MVPAGGPMGNACAPAKEVNAGRPMDHACVPAKELMILSYLDYDQELC
jgi:hypothetical protein